MIILLAPHSTSLSGGYIYNRHIAAELPEERFRYLQLPRNSAPYEPAADATLLLDSLYFDSPGWVEELAHSHHGALAMLVHYLPSLDPTISSTTATALRSAEARCLSCCRHIVVTSNYMQREVQLLLAQIGSDRGRFPWRNGLEAPDALSMPAITVAPPGVGTAGDSGRQLDHGPASPPLSSQTINPPGPGSEPHGPPAPTPEQEQPPLQLLTVANWTAAKNHAYLLPLLEEFKEYSWKWNIFGQADEGGTLLAEFKQKAEDRGLSGRIQLNAQISPGEVAQQLRRADLFLYPSRFESYGMVLAEALSAGVPIIANRTGGIPEVVGAEPAAILCNGGDEASTRRKWQRALQRLLSERAAREQLHRAALRRARTLPTWPSTATTILKALEQR